jgi:hypothetical protein
MKPSNTKDILEGRKIVYEDPCAALNISEERWHEMVQENLKKHNESEKKAKQDKFEKNKAIQMEQRR